MEKRKRTRNYQKEYYQYFSEFFKDVKKEFRESIGFREEEYLSSGELALRDAINSLPCPVRIVKIKVDVKKHKRAKDSVAYLIGYDFSNFGKLAVRYYGEVKLDKVEEHGKLLKKYFGLDKQKEKLLKNFELKGYGDPDRWYWFDVVSYDIINKRTDYLREFIFLFQTTFIDKILQKFEKRVDYVSKYGLKSDPILPLSEIIKKDKILNYFIKENKTGRTSELTIEDLQNHICGIQLIPSVPEEVKKVFNAAKKLYIFGYFEYFFFTVSLHYALLSLESVLRNKFSSIYGEPKRFVSLDEIIKKLVEKGIIPKGEASIYDAGRELRNSLSHLTSLSVMLPSSRTLYRIAYQINQIYDKK